jgi:hypothetical protein
MELTETTFSIIFSNIMYQLSVTESTKVTEGQKQPLLVCCIYVVKVIFVPLHARQTYKSSGDTVPLIPHICNGCDDLSASRLGLFIPGEDPMLSIK